jgi:hypothetical protein
VNAHNFGRLLKTSEERTPTKPSAKHGPQSSSAAHATHPRCRD